MTTRELFTALIERRYTDLRGMLKSGADVNALADWDTCALDKTGIVPGDTLLHYALWKMDRDGLEALLDYNPNINIPGRDGLSSLRIAINVGMNDIALWLIEHGADFASIDKYGMCPIHVADDPTLISTLLSNGVHVDTRARCNGWTPLHFACYNNRLDKARMLLQKGAWPSTPGHEGETPLHLSCSLPYRDVGAILALLLEAGADINAQDKKGNTALHWSMGINSINNWMHRGNPETAALLKRYGAVLDIRNAGELTALDLAKQHGGEYLQSLQ